MNQFFRIDPMELEDPLSNFEPVQYASELERSFAEDPISVLESKPFLAVSPSTPVNEAIELLNESGVSSLLVVDGEQLLGIFTERDVLQKVVEQYARVASSPVMEFMTADPTIVFESDAAAKAAAAISVAGHRHVPVVDMDEKVCGVLSPCRVFRFMESHL